MTEIISSGKKGHSPSAQEGHTTSRGGATDRKGGKSKENQIHGSGIEARTTEGEIDQDQGAHRRGERGLWQPRGRGRESSGWMRIAKRRNEKKVEEEMTRIGRGRW
jgi:hypothetical protein